MNYGYARCSTNDQKQDVTRQIRELTSMGVPEENIYMEYGSGTKIDRAQFQRLLQVIQEGDTIMVTEISRLSRSTRQLCDLIDLIKKQHLCLVIRGSITVDCRSQEMDPMSQAFLEITAVFAALERNMTISRVKSGIENARARGIKLGRPKTTMENVPDRFFRYFPLFEEHQINLSEFARLTSLSRPTVYKYIRMLREAKKGTRKNE